VHLTPPSIGTEVFNSLLANNEPYISESDWAVGCFANSGKTAAKVPQQGLWVGSAKATTSEHVLESIRKPAKATSPVSGGNKNERNSPGTGAGITLEGQRLEDRADTILNPARFGLQNPVIRKPLSTSRPARPSRSRSFR
jgi:hypothetical protein